jgi:hypothetical protein
VPLVLPEQAAQLNYQDMLDVVAWVAALIAWIKNQFAPDVHRLGPLRSAALIVRFMTAIIVLHVFEILLWAGFYRWRKCGGP